MISPKMEWQTRNAKARGKNSQPDDNSWSGDGALIGFASTLSSAHIKTGARVGSMIWGVQYLATHSQNPIFASAAGASIGSMVGNFLEDGLGKIFCSWSHYRTWDILCNKL